MFTQCHGHHKGVIMGTTASPHIRTMKHAQDTYHHLSSCCHGRLLATVTADSLELAAWPWTKHFQSRPVGCCRPSSTVVCESDEPWWVVDKLALLVDKSWRFYSVQFSTMYYPYGAWPLRFLDVKGYLLYPFISFLWWIELPEFTPACRQDCTKLWSIATPQFTGRTSEDIFQTCSKVSWILLMFPSRLFSSALLHRHRSVEKKKKHAADRCRGGHIIAVAVVLELTTTMTTIRYLYMIWIQWRQFIYRNRM